MKSYQDPNDPRNGLAYHTGKLCIEGCGRPAGTLWGPFWCQSCNAERIERIDGQLKSLIVSFKEKERNDNQS
jgi:hypothetical protein